MDENFLSPFVVEGRITSVQFNTSTVEEICASSISDCPISHPGQLSNPFLGLPLESGRCESCGTSEHGKCEGHFGYIKLPIPIYHPRHVAELKCILNVLCLKCLRLKKGKVLHDQDNKKSSTASCTVCKDVPAMSVKEAKTQEGTVYLELRLPSRSKLRDGTWDFLDRYGFHYGNDASCRTLLPFEALQIVKTIPEETRRRLAGKGYYLQTGYIMQCLPVPPNCLSVPDRSDGTTILSSDLTVTMLRRVLNKIETIKRSRSGFPNFESHEIEANDLQSVVSHYMQLRGTTKTPQDLKRKFLGPKEVDSASSRAWLDKMKTLFISKGSGFSSRSVITGDSYKRVDEIGLPLEISLKMTFEERVTAHNISRLQEMMQKGQCITYKDGSNTYAIREGSKGYPSLKIGQIVNRRIVDGDVVFINRAPTTHKHSLQALFVYIHDDHTVKINPLICAPLGADFDGDCVHIFYPQSLAAKAEVMELFTVEQQLLSSHTGCLNLQLVQDSLLSLKLLHTTFLLSKSAAQQLAVTISPVLPEPALHKTPRCGPLWTVLQVLQGILPSDLNYAADRQLICQSELLRFDFNRELVQSTLLDTLTFLVKEKGPKAALKLFNVLQPLLMEIMFSKGYSVSLKDFVVPKEDLNELKASVQDILPRLSNMRLNSTELRELQLDNHLKSIKLPIVNFLLKRSAMGYLVDSKSGSDISKVVEQLGFVGLQLYENGKFYSRGLVEDVQSHIHRKYLENKVDCRMEAFGFVKSAFFEGLNPCEELIHSISSRETLIRSSRGLSEPGTLFKNLMAILRDVTVSYDGTVRNTCTNTVIQFQYGARTCDLGSFPPGGEPVGLLAATAVSSPAYKAVLSSSQSSNSSWGQMKEILLCKVSFNRDNINARRVIFFLNDCTCGKRYCKEKAAYAVQNLLKKFTLKDFAMDFITEYQNRRSFDGSDMGAGLVCHIHLDKEKLIKFNCTVSQIHQECEDVLSRWRMKKTYLSKLFKGIRLFSSECCSLEQPLPCLHFCQDESGGSSGNNIQTTSEIMADVICPVLLGTVIKGDCRINVANVVWVDPNSTNWVRKRDKISKGEIALELVIEKNVVKQNGDAWRVGLDSCLPVMHLIDIKRSIPYGVNQIQEFLGVSCAFEQSLQRLSTSVNAVAKGVRKEHLVLVASSMTCTGRLIGFNSSGYRALLRSLKVHAPFSEATLFAPIKCFEKAAEKCHVDSLSSIVASCAWGKTVAVGTGTRFGILCNNKEVEMDRGIKLDVYDLLQLVRTNSSEKETDTGCLGGMEVDDLDVEGEDMALSPEQHAEFTPTFEDSEVSTVFENRNDSISSWKAISPPSKQDGWGGWDTVVAGSQVDVNKLERSSDPTLSVNNCDALGGWRSNDAREKSTDKPWIHAEGSKKSSNNFLGGDLWDQVVVEKEPMSDHSNAWEGWKPNVLGPPQSDACGSWKPSGFGSGENSGQIGSDVWDDNLMHTPGNQSNTSPSTDRWVDEPSKEISQDGNQVRSSRGKLLANEWNNGKNRSINRHAKFDDPGGRNASGILTATGRRMDLFTSEEDEILRDVNSTIFSIKSILHNSSNGGRVSAEDQTFILDNVFHYHPDKSAKMGDNFDYVMVDEAEGHRGSRCFYVVSTVGLREDFSYIKCMKNYVMEKYPERAESFNNKYFRKPQGPKQQATSIPDHFG